MWRKRLGNDTYDHLVKVSKRKGVDHVLVLNVLRHESGGNPKAVSGVGARGLMQIMPRHYKPCGVSDPSDPKQSITCGVGLLANHLKEHKGNVKIALAHYNGGYDGVALAKSGFNPAVGEAIHQQRRKKKSYFDWRQPKNYVKNIYAAYVADLKKMENDHA